MPRKNVSREEATVTETEIEDVESSDFPGNFTGSEDIWNYEDFVENFRIDIIRGEGDELEFDMIGISPAIANAFRRILISEVPTIAIEKVQYYNNTSIFQDDFLAHRLGLIPIKVDPRYFEYNEQAAIENPNDTLIFELKVKCSKDSSKNKDQVEGAVLNRCVYTKHLKWVPIGDQETIFRDALPQPSNDDILIAKLNPGQELDIRLVCVKGIGRDHAKFSPVATAAYRLLPKIELLRDVYNEDADKVKESFSEGVIEVVPDKKKGRKAVVSDARKDMCSRNIFRHEHLKDAVHMSLVKDHFIYTIESTGALPPNQLMEEAIDILLSKCNSFLAELHDVRR